jgi:hypothetical protein
MEADMVDVTTSDGMKADIRDEAITVITGPYPWEKGAKGCYIRGSFGPGAFMANESGAHLVARLKLAKPLVQLTRPNDTPVWVKASAVTMIRYPFDTELPDPGSDIIVKSVIMVGDFHQALRESVTTAHDLLMGAGLNIALVNGDHGQQWATFG